VNVTVVHRDAHLLVLSKPPRLPTTHPSGGDCLVRRATALDPDAPHLHASSRLDAEVTGMVTFARTKRANEALRRARREGRYGRLYLALAIAPDAPTLADAWTEAIAMDPADPRRRRAVPPGTADAKASRTHPALRAHVGPLALLALRPQTGRTHQLRVHAAAHGLPLFGDVHYGGEKRLVLPDGRVLTARRTLLHCAALTLPRVEGTGELHLRLPPPPDFARPWTTVGGDPAALDP
tara:strand:+ start:2708 stop:3418 length:711 start_codon:yes stop_codon:yes gene_type:complete